MEEEEGKGCIVLVWIMHHELLGLGNSQEEKGVVKGLEVLRY